MAKKKNTSASPKGSTGRGLEAPVHNLIGYGALLLLAVVVLAVVYSLQWYIIP